MAYTLPNGIDFADGVTTLPGVGGSAPAIVGTPLPTGDLGLFQYWTPTGLNGGFIQEQPGSPEIERAEQCTCSHTLETSWNEAKYYWSQMPRGTIVTDSAANLWRVLSCKIVRKEGIKAELSYVMESISFDSPPDEFSISEVSLDLHITKHPRYSWALLPYVTDASTYKTVGSTNIYYTEIKEAIIRLIQTYTDSPFFPSASNINGLIQTSIMNQLSVDAAGNYNFDAHVRNPNYTVANGSKPADPVTWDGVTAHMPAVNCEYFIVKVASSLASPTDPVTIALAAAKEIISKLWRQEDTPYLAGYEVVWTQYFFHSVFLNPGGYVEDPRNWVPDYFMNPYASPTVPRGYPGSTGPVGGIGGGNSDTDGAGGSPSIFDYLTFINPQCYASNGVYGGPLAMSCLRKSDTQNYERTWFKVPHTWLCAPVGKWDSDLYNQNNRPQSANDYNQLAT